MLSARVIEGTTTSVLVGPLTAVDLNRLGDHSGMAKPAETRGIDESPMTISISQAAVTRPSADAPSRPSSVGFE
jgi:hypothetical protein